MTPVMISMTTTSQQVRQYMRACAGHDHAAQAGGRVFPYSEEAAQLSGQYASHHMSLPAWGWPGQARRQPAAQSGPLPGPGAGLGAEPMDWQRQGVSTLDLRSRPPRQRELERRGRDRSAGGLSRGMSARPPNAQSWQGAAGGQVRGTDTNAIEDLSTRTGVCTKALP